MKIGVSTPVQQSQYGTTIFIILKKEGNVRVITDYQRINQELVKNMYPLPRIREKIKHMEGFQYMTTLDLNIRLRILLASQNMTTVVTQLGKFKYTCLPMSMCASGYILKAKVNELICDIEGIRTYIDDILVLIK